MKSQKWAKYRGSTRRLYGFGWELIRGDLEGRVARKLKLADMVNVWEAEIEVGGRGTARAGMMFVRGVWKFA